MSPKWREISLTLRSIMETEDAALVDMQGRQCVVPLGMMLVNEGPMVDMPKVTAKRTQKWMFDVKDLDVWSLQEGRVWAARVDGVVTVGLARCLTISDGVPVDCRLVEAA